MRKKDKLKYHRKYKLLNASPFDLKYYLLGDLLQKELAKDMIKKFVKK